MLYPFRFKKELKEKIWGGRSFESKLGFELPDSEVLYGESWEVSTHKNGESVIDNGELEGKKFTELLDERREEVLGEEIVKNYGEKFPLLIKFLDINEKLSVQVHPDNSYALEKEGEFGKAESWYVIDASEDAEVIMGFQEGVTEEIFKEKLQKNDFSDLFRIINVKAGDIINIHPGTVHATTRGSVLICEVQQNSDVTYRVYDYDREFNGEKRELHIDRAIEVVDYNSIVDMNSDGQRDEEKNGTYTMQILTKNEYYKMEKYEINGQYEDGIYKNFRVLSILDGNGEIITGEESYSLNKGDTYFVPANLNIKVKGDNLEMTKIYI